MISRLSQIWLPVVITSMPRSNKSSAKEGVMPNPAAAFSPFARTRSIECSRTKPFNFSRTIFRPGRPKISPINRICTQVDGTKLWWLALDGASSMPNCRKRKSKTYHRGHRVTQRKTTEEDQKEENQK